MRVVRRRLVLSILAFFVLLNLTVVPMVSAGYLTVVKTTYTQDLVADDNEHTYLYVEGEDSFQWRDYLINLNRYTDFDVYQYSQSSWDVASYSYAGPSERFVYDFIMGYPLSGGYLDNLTAMPRFFDFYSPYADYAVSIESSISAFNLPIGEEHSLIVGDAMAYIGVFNVTNQEFFHLTAASREDNSEFYILILNPMGEIYGEWPIPAGDIQVIPFASSGPGMYTVVVMGMSYSDGLAIIDLKLDSITPESLPYGTIIDGLLPGSEWIVDTGEVVHEEMAPTVHTYKFSSNTTHPGMIQYSVNYPELDGAVYDPFPTQIYVQCDATMNNYMSTRYIDMLDMNGDTFFYQSFNEESYYLTFIGMDDTAYTLLNREADAPVLPIQEPFFIENSNNDEASFAYRLSLGQDSVLKVNSSESGGFDWYIWTIDEDGVYRSPPLGDSSTFHGALPTYLPAGNYLLEAHTGSYGYWGIYEFALGPVVDGAGGIAVDNGDLIGVRVPADAMTFYKANISLETHDNVSVTTDYDIFNTYGYRETGWSNTLGNRQSGTSWIAFGSNFTTRLMGIPTGFDMFCDGFAIVVVSPYDVQNNTPGGSNKYYHYTVDYDVAFEEYSAEVFNATNSLSVTSIPRWSNFTLGDPGDSTEMYALYLSVDPGTWMNITYFTEDVDTINDIWIYQEVDGCTTRLDWTDLGDTATGDTSHGDFQVGSIAEELIICFSVDRDLAAEGRLDILVTTYMTNMHVKAPPLMYVGPGGALGPGGPALDGGALLIVGGVAVAVVVVVVVVYVIRKKGII